MDWTHQNVSVETDKGNTVLDALVCNPLAVHRGVDHESKYGVISFVPAGQSFGLRFLDQFSAKYAATRIHPLAIRHTTKETLIQDTDILALRSKMFRGYGKCADAFGGKSENH